MGYILSLAVFFLFIYFVGSIADNMLRYKSKKLLVKQWEEEHNKLKHKD